MNFLQRLLGFERRDAAPASDAFLAQHFGTSSGRRAFVDTDRAQGLAVAQACISVVSQNIAGVPLPLYRRAENGGRERATDHPCYGVLQHMLNENMTAFEGREMLVASLMTSGNAYARIAWSGRGQVVALYPISPSNVTLERLESGRLRYRVRDEKGRESVLLQEEMLHVRYRLSNDGVMGVSPIQLARETFKRAITEGERADAQAARAFRAEGALIHPAPLNAEKKNEMLDRLAAKIDAGGGASRIVALDGGWDWKSFSLSARDAEFLDSRKLTALDICRVFGVPPTVVGILDHGTYSNVEQESRALVVRCLAPMARRIEQALNAALLSANTRKSLFIEHDLAGLLRGDLKARYEAYRIGREWGWLSADEIRGWENLPSISGGDAYLTPLNMAHDGEART